MRDLRRSGVGALFHKVSRAKVLMNLILVDAYRLAILLVLHRILGGEWIMLIQLVRHLEALARIFLIRHRDIFSPHAYLLVPMRIQPRNRVIFTGTSVHELPHLDRVIVGSLLPPVLRRAFPTVADHQILSAFLCRLGDAVYAVEHGDSVNEIDQGAHEVLVLM